MHSGLLEFFACKPEKRDYMFNHTVMLWPILTLLHLSTD